MPDLPAEINTDKVAIDRAILNTNTQELIRYQETTTLTSYVFFYTIIVSIMIILSLLGYIIYWWVRKMLKPEYNFSYERPTIILLIVILLIPVVFLFNTIVIYYLSL